MYSNLPDAHWSLLWVVFQSNLWRVQNIQQWFCWGVQRSQCECLCVFCTIHYHNNQHINNVNINNNNGATYNNGATHNTYTTHINSTTNNNGATNNRYGPSHNNSGKWPILSSYKYRYDSDIGPLGNLLNHFGSTENIFNSNCKIYSAICRAINTSLILYCNLSCSLCDRKGTSGIVCSQQP